MGNKIPMKYLKKSAFTKLRKQLREEYAHIPEEEFNNVFDKLLQEQDDFVKEKLESKETQEELSKAFWFPLCEMAEKGTLVVQIDGVNLGDKIKSVRRFRNWYNQRRYLGYIGYC